MIAVELLGGLAILFGVATRWVAVGMAVFSLAAGFLFHFDLADQNQFINFMKNIAIVGGFLVLAANGACAFSIDNQLRNRRALA